MAGQITRDAVLRYLDSLANDTTVMPLELSEKVGLSKEQVDTYLATAPRCDEKAEVVVSSEEAKVYTTYDYPLKWFLSYSLSWPTATMGVASQFAHLAEHVLAVPRGRRQNNIWPG